MVATLGEGLTPLVLERIRSAFLNGEEQRTLDLANDMSRANLSEADVAKFFDEIGLIYKTEGAHSPRRSHPRNTHYYMRGKSIDGRDVFCKVSSSYHPDTGEFMCWTLTSFCEWQDEY